jgi:hypothetical protein
MKNAIIILLLGAMSACTLQNPTQEASYESPASLDSVFWPTFSDTSSVWEVEGVDTTETLEIEDAEYFDETEDYWNGLTEGEIIPLEDTTLSKSVPFSVTDTLNTVLGVTDVLFVWQGDTCTTDLLDTFFAVLYNNDTYCLQDTPQNLKGKTVALMVTFMLAGQPTEGVNAANDFISEILQGTGLSEYVAFSKEHQ